MNQEKIIQELVEQAYEVENVEIPLENITEIPLEDFYKIKGDKIEYREKGKRKKTEVIYCDNSFYKKIEEKEWIKAQIKKTQEKESVIQDEDLKQRIIEITEWCGKLKDYVDDKLKEFEQKQDEIVNEIKEYVDNKTK